ncbi:MAG: anaerobic selenocysteine-containing dehydrogenase, partial [Sulfurimonas sp.]
MDKTSRRQFLKGGTAAVAGTVLGIPLPVNAKTITATDFSMEKKVSVLCRMCAQKCPAVATVLDGRVVRLEPNMGTPYGAVCGRASGAIGTLYDPDRITTPLIRTGERGEGKFRKATWDEALDMVANKMKELKEQGDEKTVAYLPRFSSAGGLDKGFFQLYGTPNVVGYGDTCFGASLPVGFGAVMGGTKFSGVAGPGTGAVSADYENAKYGVLIQRNVGGALVCHPWGKTFGMGKKNGMQIVAVDPRKPSEAGESLTDWAPIKPGTDGAFLLALMNEIFTKKYYDEKVIRSKTNAEMLINIETGLPVLTQDIVKMKKGKEKHITDYYVATSTGFGFKSETKSDVQLFGEYNVVVDGVTIACKTAFQLMKDSCAENTPAWAATVTTLPESQIQDIASKLNDAKPACFLERGYRSERYASSLREKLLITQVNALLGAYGAKGGIISNGKVKLGKAIHAPKLTEPNIAKWLVKNDSKKPFMNVKFFRRAWIESIFTEKPYKSKMAVLWGQNIVGGSVGSYDIAEAMKKLEMIACVSPYWNETTMFADVILPDATFLERDECLNGKWKSPLATLGVNLRAVEPLGDSKDGYWIVNELARRIFPDDVYQEHFGEYDKVGMIALWKKQYAGIKGITKEEKATLPSLKEVLDGRVWAGDKHYKIKVKTKTGKMEIYPTALAAEYMKLKTAGNPDAEFANPLPVFNKPFFLEEKTKLENDEFVPISGFHPLGTFLGQQTKNNVLLKEILEENKADFVFINQTKGAKLGLKTGDSIEIFNTKIKDRVSIAKVMLSETIQEDALFAYYGITAGYYDGFSKKLTHHDGGGFNSNHLSEFLFSPLTAGNPAQDFTVQ